MNNLLKNVMSLINKLVENGINYIDMFDIILITTNNNNNNNDFNNITNNTYIFNFLCGSDG